MSMLLINWVAQFLLLELEAVVSMAARAPSTYKKYYIPKKRGGRRAIFHPSKQTKSIQYALMSLLDPMLSPHDCAVAYRRGLASPLLKNALWHAQQPYALHIDFNDFFPSIQPDDLFSCLTDPRNPKKIELAELDREFLREVLFIKSPNGILGLPIGAPSSPMISNGIMRQMDEEIYDYARKNEFIYTRYADDLIFSTHHRGSSVKFLEGLRTIISKCGYPHLTINEAKTRLMSRKSRRVVTGLIIGPHGSVSIGRKRKRYLRKLLNDLLHNKLSPKEMNYLKGYLAFVLDVEPGLYNRLCQKYGAHLVSRAAGQERIAAANQKLNAFLAEHPDYFSDI